MPSEDGQSSENVGTGGVYIEGLSSRTELNGGFGLACGIDSSSGRVRVRVIHPHDASVPPYATVALRPQNFRAMRLSRYPHARAEALLMNAFNDVGATLKAAFDALHSTGRKPENCLGEAMALSFIKEVELCLMDRRARLALRYPHALHRVTFH